MAHNIPPVPPEPCGLCELGVEHVTDTHSLAVDRYHHGYRDGYRAGLREAISQLEEQTRYLHAVPAWLRQRIADLTRRADDPIPREEPRG